MKTSEIVHKQPARPSSDGDGVALKRVFGGHGSTRFDPFLLLDEFGSDRPEDYRGGFPPHPHRGFETVTYMLEGKMEHRDHLGNTGTLQNGSVQWMTAGKGIIHSEMPLQEDGLMHGFQLWINLPAARKMTPAAYQDIAPALIPSYTLDGAGITAIAGAVTANQTLLEGYIPPDSREINFFDITLAAGKDLVVELPSSPQSLVYCFKGAIAVGDSGETLAQQELAVLSPGDRLILSARDSARCLLLSGKPIGEPVVQYGPFVMNTRAEIEQAINDYQSGNFV